MVQCFPRFSKSRVDATTTVSNSSDFEDSPASRTFASKHSRTKMILILSTLHAPEIVSGTTSRSVMTSGFQRSYRHGDQLEADSSRHSVCLTALGLRREPASNPVADALRSFTEFTRLTRFTLFCIHAREQGSGRGIGINIQNRRNRVNPVKSVNCAEAVRHFPFRPRI